MWSLTKRRLSAVLSCIRREFGLLCVDVTLRGSLQEDETKEGTYRDCVETPSQPTSSYGNDTTDSSCRVAHGYDCIMKLECRPHRW